jgi:hypothetical protein
LDEEAVDTNKKARVHRKDAASIFFESNGGQSRNEASLGEIRLGVAGPHIDLGNVETALEALTESCYYLTTERNRYRFSLKENLVKRYADRRASIRKEDIEERVGEEVKRVFPKGDPVERVFFPEKSSQIQDRPAISVIVLAPGQSVQDDPEIESKVEAMTREYGKAARTYKSGLIWVVPESSGPLNEEARKLLAWEAIRDERLRLDEVQRKQLDFNLKKSRRDLTESVWRTYKNVFLLGKDNEMKTVDLGLVTSSSTEGSPITLILRRLREIGDVEKDVSPRFLVRNWPPAFTEWSTRAVRDAFYASPQFPRLLEPDKVRDTVARGVSEGLFGYVGKSPKGGYDPCFYKTALNPIEVEISDDMYIVQEVETEPPRLTKLLITPSHVQLKPGGNHSFRVEGRDQYDQAFETGKVAWTATTGDITNDGVLTAGEEEGSFLVSAEAGEITETASVFISKEPPNGPPRLTKLQWSGSVSPQKWSNFYMKVLTNLIRSGEVDLEVKIEARPKDGVTEQQVEEVKSGLRGLGMSDDVTTE